MKQSVSKVATNKIQKKKGQGYLIYLAGILAITAIAFFPTIENGFTNWDDTSLITQNPLIKELSSANIKRIFTENYFGNYQPLHLLSYAIEYQFFGLDAKGYHAVSLLMHLINTVLVFFVVRYFTKGNDLATLAATLLWAINPMRTESVCWAAERKDMLYAMFFFAALIAYMKYLKPLTKDSKSGVSFKYLIIAFLFFVLSVFSKAMAVSLIPVLFLIDYYHARKFSLKLILEKLPFIILAIIMGLKSVSAASEEGSVDTTGNYTFVDRIFFASHNLLMYAVKSIIPFSQSAFYDYPAKSEAILPYQYYIAGIITILLIVFLAFNIFKKRELVFTSGFFIATVFLVLMLLPVGPTIFNERYAYIPSVMLFTYLMNLSYGLTLKKPEYKTGIFAVIALTSLIYCYQTFNRCKIWNNSVALWTNAISQFPKAAHALNNLGDAYFNENKLDSAIFYFSKAIEINPNYASALYNRGNAYGQTGKPAEALADLNNSIKFDPNRAEAYNKRGQANALTGNTQAAFNDFNKALQLKPDYAEVYFNLGITYLNTNQKQLACENLSKAVNMGFETAVKPFQEVCK